MENAAAIISTPETSTHHLQTNVVVHNEQGARNRRNGEAMKIAAIKDKEAEVDTGDDQASEEFITADQRVEFYDRSMEKVIKLSKTTIEDAELEIQKLNDDIAKHTALMKGAEDFAKQLVVVVSQPEKTVKKGEAHNAAAKTVSSKGGKK